eukprot:CAMPEP_0195509034 /NCGR_PEP_ID=MMETSP0794_2-20130614/2079_1 /TAXON_ID=515487 /ORGANISM="Stephanopyxis turris, Strain CCMP 815" /LENGTH=704 /DNA_ID=CAMNT_0040636145 /DNA_START=57 /DNA_END=2171 /DNA_ORIENTATION=+
MGAPLILIGSGIATIILGAVLTYAISKKTENSKIASDRTVATNVDKDSDENVEALDKEKYPGGYLTVLYGSQTGTAESFAIELEREGESHGFCVRIIDLEDIATPDDVKDCLLHEKYLDEDSKKCRAIFLIATYGEGESTDSSVDFVNMMKQKMGLAMSEEDLDMDENISNEEQKGDPEFFSQMEFGVFALGNTQYEHYNAMGKFFDTSIEKLGGKRVVDIGLGNDDDDLEGDFENWKDSKLWPELRKLYTEGTPVNSVAETPSSFSASLPECPFEVEFLPELKGKSDIQVDAIPKEDMQKSTRHYFTAIDCPVTVSRELRGSSDPGSTLHMEIDVSSQEDEIKYQTADNMGVLPVNDSATVESVAQALKFDLDDVFRLKGSSTHTNTSFQHIFPNPCTIRECLSRYCDLTTPPRRSELKLLSKYATDPIDKSALERMASKEGKAEYRSKIVEGHVGTVDIVSKLCPSLVIPLEHFIAAVPRLQPRLYTISSSSSLHPHSVHLTVAIFTAKKTDGSIYKGICTDHLKGIEHNGTCRVFVRNSTFRLPSDSAKPVIMIGPGTGVAPMRAFLQERSHQKHQQKLPVGKNVLYFGCKNREQDYLYADELETYEKDGTLDALYLAFSRETKSKVYVQHLLDKNAEETWQMIHEEKASIYVCGGTKMGLDVVQTLTKIVAQVGEKSDDDAKAYVDGLRSEGRFVQELWS